jgi:hypothetical protein
MKPRMTDNEIVLFASFLNNSRRYVEFGCGGSTYLASRLVTKSIIAVDSSQEWLSRVEASCQGGQVVPQLLHVDIGQTQDWGYPVDDTSRDKWATYYTKIWEDPSNAWADLYLIDGRFRVACFAKTIMHCRPDAFIAIHDFPTRKKYHCVREIARQVACIDQLFIFQPLPGSFEKALELVEANKHDAD